MKIITLLRLLAIFSVYFVSSPNTVNAKEIPRSATVSNLDDNFYHDIDELTLAVGENHACALEHVGEAEVGGEIVCWGSNNRHESDSPVGLFVQISASSHFTCGISIDSTSRATAISFSTSGRRASRRTRSASSAAALI